MADSALKQFDSWLAADGPVAVIGREFLEPALGSDAVVFPPTFAPAVKGETPAYIVDETNQGKVAVIDTVGSQANRMEPIFKQAPYSELVPRATIKIGEREVDLLDAGHRAADALVRFSSKRVELSAAFQEIAGNGNASKLAKLAPTSLVFGVWDSRGSQIKLPRLIGSTIRAFGVESLSRSAQFFSAFEKDETEDFGQPQDFLSEQGLSDAPAGRGPGGVIARGGIRRDSVLNLVALRALSAGDGEATLTLQRYILGLALIAFTAQSSIFLREGCLLVSSKQPAERKLVSRDGTRAELNVDADTALAFARAAAKAFGVGENWTAKFEKAAVAAAAESSKKSSEGKAKKAGKGAQS